jgi:hypothetical protein
LIYKFIPNDPTMTSIGAGGHNIDIGTDGLFSVPFYIVDDVRIGFAGLLTETVAVDDTVVVSEIVEEPIEDASLHE